MIDEALFRIDAFATRGMEREGPPGLALAITDADGTLAVRTYGYADLAARTPVHPQHLFQTGSTGKSFAAFIAMQEVEADRLRLEVPVTEYLPWFRAPSRFPPITVHHLLTHTAGISTGGDASPEAEGEVFALRETEAAWAPGTRFYYSNAGYKAVGLILERVVGKPYAQIVRERIFEPLGMSASEPAIVNEIRPRSAVGHVRLFDDRLEHRTQPWVPAAWSASTSADGSLSSTADDMAAYLRLILNRGRGPSGPIVTQAGFEYMAQPFAQDPESPGDYYGLGFNNREDTGRRYLGHSGGTLGYSTGMWTEDGLGVIVLQNSGRDAWWLVPYALEVARAAQDGRDLPEVPEPDDPSVIANAAEYVGLYRGAGRELNVEATVTGLASEGVALERVKNNVFHLPHPEWDAYVLRFGRESGAAVTSVSHGPQVFTNARHSGYLAATRYPPEWDSFAGHYRSHNPWSTNIRVFVREGILTLGLTNADLGETEFALKQLPSGRFAVGDTPEQMYFDTVISERVQRIVLMGQEYWRTFTP